eukprot:m.32392 g.32392  ORF g.32392 m.32392 type:complete len:505 (+) comp31647_c0_seq1:73-1587(+)
MAAGSILDSSYDVIVVGNGPNGICLSYLLSGNWPYVSVEEQHPDDFLQAKLQSPSLRDESLLRMDLESLSEGLEGRSTHPVAVLFDSLLRPDADVGGDLPSCLNWKHSPSKRISHLVIGSGEIGGSWNDYPADVLALSPGPWLGLPGYSFCSWLEDQPGAGEPSDRPTLKNIAEYYQRYVSHCGMSENFLSHTSVVRVGLRREAESPVDSSSHNHFNPSDLAHSLSDGDYANLFLNHKGEEPEASGSAMSIPGDYRFEIEVNRSIDGGGTTSQTLLAKNLVLACGVSGSPAELRIQGEDLSFVHHKFNASFLEHSGPVLIVGSGLSAADAILMALSLGYFVIHVFKRSTARSDLVFNRISHLNYHEYKKIFKLMQGKSNDRSSSRYKSYECCQLTSISKNKVCQVSKLEGGIEAEEKVSAVFVLVGSSADLSFLPHELSEIGLDPQKPVNMKNPAAVDPVTYQVQDTQNLFAVGPLVGDSFVRFGIGGALGVASTLVKRAEKHE